jgi:hypothetical protein
MGAVGNGIHINRLTGCPLIVVGGMLWVKKYKMQIESLLILQPATRN